MRFCHDRHLSLAVSLVAVGLFAFGSSVAHASGSLLAGACRSSVRVGVLPTRARVGFTPPRARMPYALGARGLIVAIPSVPLYSPLPAGGKQNKILWVARVVNKQTRSASLKISAQRMRGTERLGRPVHRTVTPGPGPSYVNLPAAGCWRLTLHRQGHTDQLDLQYRHPQ